MVELQELRCKSCGAVLTKDDVHWDLGLAQCSHCGSVFSLHGLAPPVEQAAPKPDRRRKPVPMPKNIEVINTGDVFQISYRWFGPQYIFLVIFALFWNGFLLVWNGLAISMGAWEMMLFSLLHVAIGIVIGYYALAGLINSTTIWVQADLLGIQHHPLPWPGSKRLMASDIEQLYTKKVTRYSRSGPSHTYEVHAILRQAAKEKLVGGLREAEQALYIEQELERYLGIQDRPVRGELPR